MWTGGQYGIANVNVKIGRRRRREAAGVHGLIGFSRD